MSALIRVSHYLRNIFLEIAVDYHVKFKKTLLVFRLAIHIDFN